MTSVHPGAVPSTEDEALGLVEAGEAIGVPTAAVMLQSLATTLAQPRSLVREGRRVTRETVRIAAGRSNRTPARGDRRFTDPAWAQNPVYRRINQEYLVLSEALSRLVDDLDVHGKKWQDAERARFVANIVASAVAPTNFLPTNPAALKRAFDTGGRSLVRGAGHWWHDVRTNGGMPAQTDRSAFQVGRRPRRDTRGGRAPRRARRADPIHAVDPYRQRAASTHRAAADRSLLLPRPASGSKLRRIRGEPRPAGLHPQLAQSDRRHGWDRSGCLRRTGPVGDGCDRRDLLQPPDSARSGSAPAGSCCPAC